MKPYSASSEWEKVLGFSVIQQISSKITLFQQGDSPQSAIFLKSGWVRLARLEQDGQEKIAALCLSGAMLGIAELIAEQTHPATVITSTECQLHSISAQTFLSVLKTDQQFSWHINRALSLQINAHMIHSMQLKGASSRSRLEQLLRRLLCAENPLGITLSGMPEESRLPFPLQYQELALMIGVTPEYLGRILKEMEHEGLIRRDGHQIIVSDPERLWHHPEVQSFIGSDSSQVKEINLSGWIFT